MWMLTVHLDYGIMTLFGVAETIWAGFLSNNSSLRVNVKYL